MLIVIEPKSKRRNAWNWLLVVPALALAFPAIYSRPTPELFGFPFFYWYQFVWVVLTSFLLYLVYRALKSR